LSIFTSAAAAEGWSLALTFGDTANISIAIIAGATKPAIQTFFLVIVLFPFSLMFLLDLSWPDPAP
jgi:hypothetical protein